ncbi:MAG: HAMP domain-containing histidine kinase [Actinobacteria bacterium]|nr:HAMP domain-containing histidine kinase [Actinomycetota bacterium]
MAARARAGRGEHRRRRRSLVVVVALSLLAGALAGGAFWWIRRERLEGAALRSVETARIQLEFAAQNLPAEPAARDLRSLVDQLGDLDFEAVIRANGDVSSTRPLSFGIGHVPSELAALVGDGVLAYQRTDVNGAPYLVVGGPAGPAEVYMFFPESELSSGITILGLGLVAGWAGAVVAMILVALAGLQSRVRALSEARARERRFTSDVAHELRTPLSAIVAEASLLREELERLPPEARRPAELLVQDVERLRRLVEDLLEISRLDAGGEEVRVEPVDVAALVEGVVRARGWSPRVAVEGEAVVASTDRRRLERIVANLVGNALTHGGRDVRVRMGRDGAGLALEVSDRGPGIPPDALPHLFDRFYKADPSRTGTGTGLGLAIALENARLLGGDIEVRSEPGAGATFTVRLPQGPRGP